jgi:hypothetical protein
MKEVDHKDDLDVYGGDNIKMDFNKINWEVVH